MRSTLRPVFNGITVGAAWLACAFGAQAATVPPIKPGLWELQMEKEGGGPAAPDMSEEWKKMPPEQRQAIQAMMKKHGVGINGSVNNVKLCLDKASLDKGSWQGEQNQQHCKTDTSQSGNNWKWHTVCGAPYNTVSDSEATITNSESYVVKSKTTSTIQGQTQTTQHTIRSKWLAADCGDIQPIQSMKPPPMMRGPMGQPLPKGGY